MKEKYDALYERINNLNAEKDNNILNKLNEMTAMAPAMAPAMSAGVERDYRALADPLYPPLKRNPPGLPINIETRESGGDYQQVGMLSKTTNINGDLASPGSNTDSNVMPLFGKPTYKGSSNWLYYTASNGGIKIPLTINSKDCTDDRGCSEINDGDSINIDEFNGAFNAKIYKFDKPRYIPYV
jgi:hypothetical protein